MLHVCYAFIKHFRALDHIEINLDARYSCHFDSSSKVLLIDKKEELPKGFWGDGIYSLAAIVGDNGAGKSTALSFLLNDLLEGATGNDEKGVYVFEDNGELFYSGDVAEIKSRLPFKVSRHSSPSIPSFYYSSHFMPYVTANDVRCFELAGSYIASDSWLLIKDFQNYTNVDSLSLNKPIGEHLYSHISQNNYRICLLLADKAICESFSGFKLPEFVLIGPNLSGQRAFQNDRSRFKEDIPRFPNISSLNEKHRLLALWVYHNLLNIYTDGMLERESSLLELINDWCNLIVSIKDKTLDYYRDLIESKTNLNPEVKNAAISIADVLTKVTRLAHFKENGVGQAWFTIDVNQESDSLKELADCISSNRHLVSRFFDFSYSHVNNGSECILSSGEQEMLNLFSRLYEAIILNPNKFGVEKRPQLIMLDEAEVGFHPEWQRRYISLVLHFLRLLPLKGWSFQIIITTHSPILLSDIPSCCVNYLRICNGRSVNYYLNEKETFATNVFQLYRDSFWLDKGMIGAYAYERIQELVRRLSDGDVENFEEVISEIKLIGDSRIKDYLMSLLSQNHPAEAIEYYKSQIAKIEMMQETKKHE